MSYGVWEGLEVAGRGKGRLVLVEVTHNVSFCMYDERFHAGL